jgi:hypothetical protein
MRYSIYITKEGLINWIEKMPRKPLPPVYESEVGHSDGSTSTLYASGDFGHTNALKKYNKAIDQAKAESIPFDMSDDWTEGTLETYLAKPSGKRSYLCGSGEVFAALIKDTIYPIELDADIQKVNVDVYMCTTCKSDCYNKMVSCKNPVVARIIPKKAEESERFKKPSTEEVAEFALLFQTDGGENPINREVLVEMVGFASMVIDRLYETGDITKPSSKEKPL